MGVPALFRWLSKKYPKIVERVVEDTPTLDPSNLDPSTGEPTIYPIDYASANPNGFEVDNLYLDMNGIVHPCTHPEKGDAPLTEEDMMVEIFKYTERVVNMARPRKLLMMAIDGVAPRAKMNQQRSRRFRAAQEAADKMEEAKEAVRLFAAMGHAVSEEAQAEAEKIAWDSNAITPGTPFMDLLAASLRYWVSHKLNTDPGWKGLTVIISDASVPGEGEHKIMDWIRRQRVHPDHDPNTSHVIYGLDADLIMLALATHEPHFKVLREDVFFQQSRDSGCHRCGQTGHIAANCTGEKKIKQDAHDIKNKPMDDKPFIFLDVSCLREYLAVELDLRYPGIPFDLERAIDDWVFLIFFVGNDFLPHLPSLEIREGAIDTLLAIWKREFGRMGGYVTNHGKVELARAQIILDGLAQSEDDIFRRRQQAEERQNPAMKRQNWNNNSEKEKGPVHGTMTLNDVDYVAVGPATGPSLHPSLPTKPGFAPKLEETANGSKESAASAVPKVATPNVDANKSAAALLRKQMKANLKSSVEETPEVPGQEEVKGEEEASVAPAAKDVEEQQDVADENGAEAAAVAGAEDDSDYAEATPAPEEAGAAPRGKKRKAKAQQPVVDAEDEDDELEAPPNPDADQTIPKRNKLKVASNGVVESEDTVKLWEPGYRERYYMQKFSVPLEDVEFRKKLVHSYLEGLSWVLAYYYQGAPSWQWFFPYHYAPFAADFQNIEQYEIEFKVGQPFKPFQQLMGVFPAASKVHLPKPFQLLMTEEDSPIIDFYPLDFEIDMNGKKMAWQGTALLPFIEQQRLMDAMKTKEGELTPDEVRRNTWGDNVAYVSEDAPLHPHLARLYTKQYQQTHLLPMKNGKQAIAMSPIDTRISRGIAGSASPAEGYIPGSTLHTPLPNIDACPDIHDNRTLMVKYFFPGRLAPHRSVVLPGVRPPPSLLTEQDRENVRSGRRGRGGGGGGGRGGFGNGHMGGGGYSNGGRSGTSSGYNTPPSNGYAAQSYSAAPMAYNALPAPRHNRFDSSNLNGGSSGQGYNGNGYETTASAYGPIRPAGQNAYGGQQSSPYGAPMFGGAAPPNPYGASQSNVYHPVTPYAPPPAAYGYGYPPAAGGGAPARGGMSGGRGGHVQTGQRFQPYPQARY